MSTGEEHREVVLLEESMGEEEDVGAGRFHLRGRIPAGSMLVLLRTNSRKRQRLRALSVDHSRGTACFVVCVISLVVFIPERNKALTKM